MAYLKRGGDRCPDRAPAFQAVILMVDIYLFFPETRQDKSRFSRLFCGSFPHYLIIRMVILISGKAQSSVFLAHSLSSYSTKAVCQLWGTVLLVTAKVLRYLAILSGRSQLTLALRYLAFLSGWPQLTLALRCLAILSCWLRLTLALRYPAILSCWSQLTLALRYPAILSGWAGGWHSCNVAEIPYQYTFLEYLIKPSWPCFPILAECCCKAIDSSAFVSFFINIRCFKDFPSTESHPLHIY